jgi:hypothetical protein
MNEFSHETSRPDELAACTGPIADALGKAWRDKQAQMASG